MNSKWINTRLAGDVRSDVQANDGQGNSHVLGGHTPTDRVHGLTAGLRDSYAPSGMSDHVCVVRGTAAGTRVLEGGLFLRPRLERTDAELAGTDRQRCEGNGFEGTFLGSTPAGSTGLVAALAGLARGTSGHTTSLSIKQSRDLVPIG